MVAYVAAMSLPLASCDAFVAVSALAACVAFVAVVAVVATSAFVARATGVPPERRESMRPPSARSACERADASADRALSASSFV